MYVFQNDHGVMQRRCEMKDVIKYTIKIILTVSSTIALILGCYSKEYIVVLQLVWHGQ
mgnify:CR=1 FL=1